MKDHLLAIDAGTQSVRALLFDLKGNLAGRVRVPIEPYFSAQPGWAEQHADVYWDALVQACRQLWTQPGITPDMVAGLALTTQRGTLINVDQDGRPLRPAIVWLDQRSTPGLTPVGGLWGVIFRLIRMRETIAYLQSEAEANWIRVNQPDVWKQTHKFLLLSGYLTFRLTGRYVDSVGCQVAYIPFDYRGLKWAAPGDWKWQATPMDPAILPDLVPPGGKLGELDADAAAATGLPIGLPVIAAAADKACEMLGSGGVEPHVGCLGYGTTATFNVLSRKYVELVPYIPPYPGAIPGAYNLEFQIYRGYWMVSWFREQFGHREQQLALERGVEAEALFDALVKDVPPGAMGLMLQPYWTPGLKVPGREAKGAVIGFGDVHTRAHLYRAILEGVAYGLRDGKERCERRSRIPVTELRVSGGGSQSDVAMQITADVFGLPAARPHTFEAAGLGAAINGAVGLRLHPDFGTAVREMTRIGRAFEPEPHAQAVYDALYRTVYQRMYQRLQPLYQAIRDITGYPPPTE